MKAGKGYLILLTAVFLCAAAVWMSRDAVETVSEKNETTETPVETGEVVTDDHGEERMELSETTIFHEISYKRDR